MNQPRLALRQLSRRGFASLSSRRAPAQYDTAGRAQGFARRVPRQQPSELSTTPPSQPVSGNQDPASATDSHDKVAHALQQSSANDSNSLLAPVHVPEDKHGILQSSHPSTSILANSSIVVQRQLEMMNVMLGFEQANKYVIMDGQGNHIGYLAEQDHGFGSAMARQLARTHRSFTTHVFDRHEKEVLRFHRPFSWINSRIRIYDATGTGNGSYSSSAALQGTSAGSVSSQTSAQVVETPLSDMRIIGEAQQQWAPLRRKYNLFIHRPVSPGEDSSAPQLTAGELTLSNSTALTVGDDSQAIAQHSMAQFAYVDEPFLSWDFSLKSETQQLLGSVNRNFAGFAREIFTDTGVYALRMDAAALAAEDNATLGMTLDQRAVMLATAVSIDFDYFSRHSGTAGGIGGGGFFPMWFPGMGGGGGAAAGEAGAAGAGAAGGAAAGEAGAVGEAGAAARGVGGAAGAGEGAMAGAGTMAGYEAMQGMRGGRSAGDDASPTNDAAPPPSQMEMPYDQPHQGDAQQRDQLNQDFVGDWPRGGGGNSPGDSGQQQGGGDGGGDGEGGGFSLWDFFDGDS